MRSQPARRGDLHEADRALTPLAPALLGCLIQFAPHPPPPLLGAALRVREMALVGIRGVARPGIRSCRRLARGTVGVASRNRACSAHASGNPGSSAPCRAPGGPAPGPRCRQARIPGRESCRLPTSANSRTGIRPIAEKRRFQDLARTTLCPATPIHRPRRGLPQRTAPRTRGKPPPRTGPIPCRAK